MSKKTRILAVALSVVLIASVLGSGAALAAENETQTVEEEDTEYVTVNGTDDGNETVDDGNETVDDGNETVDDGNETVDDGNESLDGNETTHQPFGEVVTAFVHGLVDGSNNETNTTADANMTLGQQIAAFVVANNPGNAPDHAGPGGDKGPGDAGPPEHAGPDGNETGKPAHAGGNEAGKPADVGPDGEKGPSGDDERGGGPPADKGKRGGR